MIVCYMGKGDEVRISYDFFAKKNEKKTCNMRKEKKIFVLLPNIMCVYIFFLGE